MKRLYSSASLISVRLYIILYPSIAYSVDFSDVDKNLVSKLINQHLNVLSQSEWIGESTLVEYENPVCQKILKTHYALRFGKLTWSGSVHVGGELDVVFKYDIIEKNNVSIDYRRRRDFYLSVCRKDLPDNWSRRYSASISIHTQAVLSNGYSETVNYSNTIYSEIGSSSYSQAISRNIPNSSKILLRLISVRATSCDVCKPIGTTTTHDYDFIRDFSSIGIWMNGNRSDYVLLEKSR